ncbi:MAG: hypothetical protein IJA88_00130 [Clostridia bacterium]|nr:hypothetical protein [Clostridia bacterium]
MTKKEYSAEINKKVKLPEENVEYTFIFPGQKFVTYTYCGLNDKGRLILYNVKQKTFSNMSPGWFSALCGKRKQLIRTKRLDGYVPPKIEPRTIEPTTEQESRESKMIRQLRELSPALALSVQMTIGYPPEELATELENVLNDKDEVLYDRNYVNRVFNAYLKAQTILLNAGLRTLA